MAKPSFVSCKVLVVDHDPTSLSTVSAMLQHWLYDVLTVESTVEALATIRNQQDFDLVVTELHMPEMNGLTLQKKINEEFNNLPVIVMSYDDQLSVKLQNLKSGVVFYIVKPVKLDDLKNVWQFAVTSKTGKSIWQRKAASSRVTWTYELHNKFIEAISYIGLDKAVPSNILEFMNVPGLNREQVASHLQRYRNAEKGTSGALENLRTTLASGTGHSSMTLQDAQMRHNQRPTITTTSSCWNSSGLEDMESINTLGLNGSYGLMNGTAGAFGQLAPGESSSSAGIGDIGNYQFPSYAFAVANEQAINTSLMPPLSSQQHYCFGNSDPGSLLFEQSDHQFLHHQAEVNLPINQSQNPDLDGDYGVGVDASWDQPLLDPTLEQQQGNQNNINSELNGPYPPENYTSENQDLLEEFIENLFA